MHKRLAIIPIILGLAIFAAGCMVLKARVYEVDDTFVYVGEAVNTTNVDVEQAYVKLEYLDGAGNVLATQFVSPCTRTLQAGATSPVRSVLPNGGLSVASVRTGVQWVTIADRALPNLQFSGLDVSQVDTTLMANGTVKNIGGATYAGVHVCLAAYGSDGNVVGVGDAFLDTPTLVANASSHFGISTDMSGDEVASQYKLWADGWDVAAGSVTGAVMSAVSTVPVATATPSPTISPTATPTPTATPPA